MDTTKNQLAKITSPSLRTALSIADSRALTLATQRLTVNQVINQEVTYKKLADELDTAQNTVRILQELPEGEDKTRFIQAATARVDQLSHQVQQFEWRCLSELRVLDEQGLIKNLSLLIIDVLEFFDIASNMTKEKLESLSYLITAEMGGMGLEDVALCFKNAKAAAYGPSYNRLDGAVLMSWLQAYKKDKLDRLEVVKRSERLLHKDDPYRLPEPDRAGPAPPSAKDFTELIKDGEARLKAAGFDVTKPKQRKK